MTSAPRFFVERDVMARSFKIHLRFTGPNGSFGVMQPGAVYEVRPDPTGVIPNEDGEKLQPMLELRDIDGEPALQSLMDELWKEGFRPKDIGTAGHLSATQKHLEDMRAIAFHSAGVKPPEEKA